MAHTPKKAKGRANCGRFYPVPYVLNDSPAFISLSFVAFKLWHNLMRQYNGRNNGRICAVPSQMEKRGWAESSLFKALAELQEKGFIEKTRQGGLGPMGSRICTYYRLTHLPLDADEELEISRAPPTNKYLKWKPPTEKPSKKK
ncbi:MAG: hypothetical protein ACXW17_07620 [Methylomagnum sp.]